MNYTEYDTQKLLHIIDSLPYNVGRCKNCAYNDDCELMERFISERHENRNRFMSRWFCGDWQDEENKDLFEAGI